MPSVHSIIVFSGAALLLAAMPGPGLFYVVGRTLAAGRADGFASCFGTMLGGLVHVAAGAAGVSAILMNSATAFSVLKLCGCAYLVVLAVQTWRSATPVLSTRHAKKIPNAGRALRQAVVVEATNPKTAAFFLALVPQFIVLERGNAALQFVVFGLIAVCLNTAMDVLAVAMASTLRNRFGGDGSIVRRLHRASALLLGGLGISFLFTRRPA